MAMLMRPERPIDRSWGLIRVTWNELLTKELVVVGAVMIIGLAMALGIAIVFPIPADTAAEWLAQVPG
jgi:hypothetical protein